MGVAVTYIQYSLVELQGWIAQWLEHLVYVQKVLGSIPGLVTFLYFNSYWAVFYYGKSESQARRLFTFVFFAQA